MFLDTVAMLVTENKKIEARYPHAEQSSSYIGRRQKWAPSIGHSFVAVDNLEPNPLPSERERESERNKDRRDNERLRLIR